MIKRKITEAQIDGLGTCYFRALSAGCSMRMARIQAGPETDTEKTILILAEMIKDCWVDSEGNPKVTDRDELLDQYEIGTFNLLAAKINELFMLAPAGAAEKNSESIPASGSPSN